MKRALTASQLAQLTADLNEARVAHRRSNGGGPALSYLEAWDVRTALIRIFGYGGFSYSTKVEILSWEPEAPKRSGGTQFRVTAMATVRLYIPQLDAYWEEAAVSSQAQPDPGECADFAVKTAESDALKRAAVNMGTQFGLSLYNKGATGDVVKVIREPEQAKILRRLAAGEKPGAIDASVEAEEPKDEDRTYGYDPEHGEVSVPTGHVDQEGDYQETPMALEGIEVDPQKQADATAAVRSGFNRRK